MPTPRALMASCFFLLALPVWGSESAQSTRFSAPWWGPETAVSYVGFYGLRGKADWGNLLLGLEIRGGRFWWDLHVISGVLIASDGSAFLYGGVLADVPIGDVVHGILSFAPGFYSGGVDHDLGFPLEFRSTAEVSLAVTSGVRLGVSFSHMSNGKLAHLNTGVESLSLTVTLFALPY